MPQPAASMHAYAPPTAVNRRIAPNPANSSLGADCWASETTAPALARTFEPHRLGSLDSGKGRAGVVSDAGYPRIRESTRSTAAGNKKRKLCYFLEGR
jgi:hypothetical protein